MKKLWVAAGLALLVVIALAGCSAQSTSSHIDLPSGWSSTTADNGRISISGPDGSGGTIWPVIAPTSFSADSLATLLTTLATQSNSQAQWSKPAVSADSAVSTSTSGGVSAVAILGTRTAGGITSAVLYEGHGPTPKFTAEAKDLTKIFSSFTVAGAPTATPKPSLTFEKFTDPSGQNAFTVESPMGWTASGGVFHMNGYDTHVAFGAVSPSKKSSILIGDPQLFIFNEPGSIGALQAAASPAYKTYVEGYHPGAEYSVWYVTRLAEAQGCTNLKFTSKSSLDQLANIGSTVVNTGAVTATYSAGLVDFTCTLNGVTFYGESIALTTEAVGGYLNTSRIWAVLDFNLGYSSDPKAEHFNEAFQHVLASFKLNLSWAQSVSETMVSQAKIQADAADSIRETISSGYWGRQAIMDGISQRRSDATLGITQTVDSATGAEVAVESGKNYYWIDSQGNIAGTDVSGVPSLDFRQLLVVN
jgi:hypothetical protein